MTEARHMHSLRPAQQESREGKEGTADPADSPSRHPHFSNTHQEATTTHCLRKQSDACTFVFTSHNGQDVELA